MSQQQLLEIGTGFDRYIYSVSSTPEPSNFEFHIENLKLPSQQTGDKIIKLATGINHVLYLTESGKVYGRGWNAYNQLGISRLDLENKKSEYEKLSFVNANFLENYFVKDITCGYNFSYFKAKPLGNNDNKYQLYSVGWNNGNCCGHLRNETATHQLNLEIVYQYIDPNKDDESINNLKPFEFTNDIKLMEGGGSFVVILVNNDQSKTTSCYVIGDKNALGNENNNTNYNFLKPHNYINKVKYKKVFHLSTYADATIVLTDIGNIYLVGNEKLTNKNYTKLTLVNDLYKIEGKNPKQIIYLENSVIISTTDNFVFILTNSDVYKLEFQTSIKLMCGKGAMAFVITNDHKIYLIYSENYKITNSENNPFVLSVSDKCLDDGFRCIGKIELNLSSVIEDYNHFMNYPNYYDVKMSCCNTVTYLLIEKKYNTLFFNNLSNQLQQQYNKEEDRINFFDIRFK